MLRIVDQAARTDTGRQRHANEDAYFARPPIFVVADGMGGAQAGEVASRIAANAFDEGFEGDDLERNLAERARLANREIFELSREDESRSGMGTTLTAAVFSGNEVGVVHVGDSRAYLFRDGELRQLTRDHSLVEELRRQGRLTTQEAEEHPQRSIITRALGPEPEIEPDVHTHQTRAGDVFLLCSDGLTSMLEPDAIKQILQDRSSLTDAARQMVSEANREGGRDNITVVCFEVGGELEGGDGGPAADETVVNLKAPVVEGPSTRPPRRAEPRPTALRRTPIVAGRKRTRWRRRVVVTGVAVALLAAAVIGASAGIRSVYFIGRDDHGLIALYRGLPYELPGDLRLYGEEYVSSVPAASLTPVERRRLLDHQLRSRGDAAGVIRTIERGERGR